MAVHVVQGRDPWWAPLAVNVLGGLFNDWQQREKNKKEAAYLGELAKMYNGMQDGQNDTAPAPAQDTGQGLLNTNMAVPDGYNADGWANTFHKTDTPLTRFDLGTAGLAPTAPATAATTAPINAWANALGNSGNTLTQFDTNTAGIVPSTAQTPATATIPNGATQGQGTARAPIITPMDFYRAALELAGTKRFRMLNPDRVQAMLTPYMKLNEEARQEQMRQDAADRYMNAENDTDKLNQLYASTILGVTPQALLTSGQERYKYDNPYLQQYVQNTGATTRYGTFDPRRGTFNQAGEFENELTPQQQLDHQFRMLQHEANIAQQKAQMNYNYASLKQQGDLERARLDATNNSVSQIFTGNDGYQYIITKGGSQRKATDVPGLTTVQRSIIEMNEGRIKEIRSQREQLQKSRNTYVNKGQSDSPDVAEIDRQLTELDRQEKEYQNKILNIYQSVPTGQQGQPVADNNPKLVGTGMDIGANMLGIENPTITTHFNTPRKKKDGTPYGHAGVDYAMPKDHPIRMADVGTAMRVTKVANDPNGYGNYVEAQGELTGTDGNKHTISIRWAHMGNGTVNVAKGQEIRFGDLIGKVGNTGNSRGKNGGYHLHLETRIDGKLVNPRKFNELIAPYIAYSKTNKPNTFAGVTPPPKATVMGRQKETTVAYRNPKTGREVSQADVEETERKAKAGKIDTIDPNGNISAQVHEHYLNNGFERATIADNQNIQGQTQTTSDDKFPIAEQPTAQTITAPDPLDWRPSYMRVNLPLPPKTIWARNQAQNSATLTSNPTRVQPATSISFTSPTVPQQPTASTVIPDTENETKSERALAALNGQFNTWDEIYRNRYPFSSMSDFWRV